MTGAWYVADVGLCVLLGVGIGALLSFSTAAATTIVRVKRSVVLHMTQTYDKRKGGRKNRAPSRLSEVIAAVFPVVSSLFSRCRAAPLLVQGATGPRGG